MDETLFFLKNLFGGLKEGFISVNWFEGKPEFLKIRWFTTDQLQEMAEFAAEVGKKHNTYFSVNPRKHKLAGSKRGEAEDISSVIGLYCDLDIKGAAHAENDLPESEEELIAFIRTIPKDPTIIVSSGNGIHLYWLFREPFVIGDQYAYISGISKGWESLIKKNARKKYGWKFDSVADLPRMLRLPGTINMKLDPPTECSIKEMNDAWYEPADFEKYSSADSAETPAASGDDEEDAFAEMGKGSSEELIKGCRFLQHCRDDAATLKEPEWYAAISNLALTADGKDAVHDISRPYPRYSYAETQRKFCHALLEDKPVTCDYIRNVLGFDCGKNCGVRCPVGLVHERKADPDNEVAPPVWDNPIPFDTPDLPAFPIDALPKELRDFDIALAESTQTPLDMAACASIVVCSIAMQGKIDVRGKPDWVEQTNIYMLIVMESSERKSAVLNAVAKPLNDYETEQNKQKSGAIVESSIRKGMLEKRRTALEVQAAKGQASEEDIRQLADEIASYREEKPLKLYVDDITTEKLTSVLAENDGVSAILSTEGGIFDILAGSYSKNVNIDVLLKGYSGDPIRVDRIGRSSESILRPALSVLLMVQPNVLSGIMKNDTFRGRGLTARFLYCLPKSHVGTRIYRSPAVPLGVKEAYERRILNILKDEPAGGREVILLSAEADRMLEEFSNELEPKLKKEYEDFADWAGKIVGNTLRLSAVLCRASVERNFDFLETPAPLEVSGKNMSDAIRIGRYFIEHAKAAYDLMGADPMNRKCMKVVSILRDKEICEFSRRDLMRNDKSLKNVEEAQPVINRLIDYGYIAEKITAPKKTGGRPSFRYLVNPKVLK